MEKNQYNLCLKVLRCLHQAGVLKDIVLIGSWCMPFYRDYFGGTEILTTLKTRDIDFLIPRPSTVKAKVHVPALLKSLGFIVGFQGTAGYMRFEHPDLIVEFLTPEKGKGLDKPHPLPQLGMNAVALRYLDLLAQNVIEVKVEDIPVSMPHPAEFAIHKLIIFQRRKAREKAEKDQGMAIALLKALMNKDELDKIKHALDSVPPKWRKRVVEGLKKAGEADLLKQLS